MTRLGPEIPPTGGLPLCFADLLPSFGADFVAEAKGFLGVEHAGLECSGTACLVVILTALKRRSARRTVVVPAYTCPLVALAVAHCGLTLQICDLAPDSLDLDFEMLVSLCNEDTLAVIPTHLAGRVVDVGSACRIASAAGAYVVEDAAQAFGARNHGSSVGLEGDAGFFSFAVGKGLTMYEGGLWVTRSAELAADFAQTSREIIPRSIALELQRCVELLAYSLVYRPSLLAFVYGNPLRKAVDQGNIAEAIGDVFSPAIPLHRVGAWRRGVAVRALRRLPDLLAQQKETAKLRRSRLMTLPGIQVFGDASERRGVWPSLMILLPSEEKRDAILAELWREGLGATRMFASALPDYDYLKPFVAPANCRNARDFAERSLSISNSHWLDEAKFGRIVAVVKRYL